ncbi:hypothetical protein EJ04DRAFT_562498 [Polyplosphaeria fusca]|uniref:Uncharacterized protein n=1 Tax=Polyplosphaeria fusca TaxID=682080 RepID=A0A9P4R0P2_9PLEO|nr:hypothetical protein EJ04DRAFT_562498 [Polyplosphaeria fusca]
MSFGNHQVIDIFGQLRSLFDVQDCLEDPSFSASSLSNPIHALFDERRWLRGYEQYTPTFRQRLLPALRLASRLIQEECHLAWFCHVTFGHLGTDAQNRQYLGVSSSAQSPEAINVVKKNLRDMASVISLMWWPRKYRDTKDGKAWGLCFQSLRDLPWVNDFERRDFPSVPDRRWNNSHPIICLNPIFQEFFYDGFATASRCTQYRMLYLLATTLVHELVHAYWMFIDREEFHDYDWGQEPLFNRHDEKSELGFSWETTTLGRVADAIEGTTLSPRGPTMLFSIQTSTYKNSRDRVAELGKLIDDRGCRVQEITHLLPPYDINLPTLPYRGNARTGTSGKNMPANAICVIHAIPMSWVAKWFSESVWRKRAEDFKTRGDYVPPGLGPTLVLVYESMDDSIEYLSVSIKSEADPGLDAARNNALATGLYRTPRY